MKREIEFRHLRYFVAVAETLHFGKAAQQLGMAQPPLSQQIRALEDRLGHPLFERTTRGVQLTRVGHFFLDRARNLLAKLSEDVETARRLAEGQEGVLTVGFSGSTMFTALPKAILLYRNTNPKVDLRLRELATADQLASLMDRTLDLGFLRDGEARDGLTIETILREPFVAVIPAHHKLRTKGLISPRELKDEPFVLFARKMGNLAYDRTVACCEADGFRPNFVQDAPQWPTVLRLIAAGLGVSLAPACVASVRTPGVLFKKVRSQHWTSIDIGMRTKPENPATDAFLTMARKEFSKMNSSSASRHPKPNR